MYSKLLQFQVYYQRNETYEVPPVFICPPIWYDTRKIKSTGLSEEAVVFAFTYLLKYTTSNLTRDQVKSAETEFLEYFRQNNFSRIEDFYFNVALDSESFIGQCELCVSKQNLSKVRFCNTVCYKLHLQDIDSRLQIDALPAAIELFSQNFTSKMQLPKPRSRYALIIQEDERFPNPAKEIYFEPNTCNNIYVTPKVNKFVSTTQRPCVENSDRNYSFKLCQSDCILKNHIAKCMGCYVLGFFDGPSNDSEEYPLCNVYKFVPNFDKCMANLSNNAQSCLAKCSPPCTQNTYDVSVSTLKHELTPIQSETDFIIIQLFYQVTTFGIETYEEVFTYSFSSMVSNVGGQLGLWIGASVMTLIQLFVFCLKSCCSGSFYKPFRNIVKFRSFKVPENKNTYS